MALLLVIIYIVIFIAFLKAMLHTARRKHPDDHDHRSTNGVHRKIDGEQEASNWFTAVKVINYN